MGVSVGLLEGRRALQGDLDRLDTGPPSRKVRLNKTKCWDMLFGQNNPCSATGWGQSDMTVARQKGI